MRLMKFAASVAALAVMAITSGAHAQDVELVVNGDFEGTIGAVADGTPGQINPFEGGGLATVDATNPFDSTNHATLTFTGADAGFAGFQYQIDGITVGEEYTFSLYAATDGPNLGGVDGEFRLEYLDADGAFVIDQFANNLSLNAATDTFALFTQSSTAPVGATSLRAVVATQTFGTGADGTDSNVGTLFVDNLSVTGPAITAAIPEPGSVALLGLAACGLVARRRR